MKCDKLKAEPMIINDDYTALYYPKKSVDDAIAELKQKLEDAKASAYAESVDAGMENRRLKRALWLARAERAKWQSLYYWYAISDKYKSRKFDEVEQKCLKKAEEYK